MASRYITRTLFAAFIGASSTLAATLWQVDASGAHSCDIGCMSSPWRPILTGDKARAALALARDIAEQLTGLKPGSSDPSLAGGFAGIALVHAYLDACFPDENHREHALEAVERALDGIESVLGNPALYGGFTGVAWALAHLELSLWDSADVDDLQPLDEALLDLLGLDWAGDYDLISGLVGFGVYALERPDSPLMARCLERIVAHLESLSEPGAPASGVPLGSGVTWKTPARLLPPHQRVGAPDGYYNLGIAHGVPGAIALLAQMCVRPLPPAGAAQLLRAALDWWVARGLVPECSDEMYSWLIPGTQPSASRTAWCYGDPGVAIALVQAGSALGDDDIFHHGVAIGARAAARTYEQSGVVDAPLCHGAAGLAHLFNRLYQATRDDRFLLSAQRWLDKLMDMRQPGRGIAGYLSWVPSFDGEVKKLVWQGQPGVLTGVAGIALTLLAATTPIEPLWDRHLLCAAPVRDPSRAG